MAAITWTEVLALPGASSSQLANVGLVAQTMILAYVNNELDPKNYDGEDGPTTKMARAFMAAHFGLLAPHIGIVTSEGEDDLSIGYAVPPIPPGSGFWATSGFGLAFWQLRQSSLGRLPWVL